MSASPTDSNAPKSAFPDESPDLAEALRDRYEIIREAGRGASAIVYYARDLRHHRAVALKALNPDVSAVAGERFLREIEVSAGMQHPHILPTYDSGIAAGRLYFVMPFVDGGSLRQRLEKEPRLPVDEALRYAHEVAVAIAFAHDRGIVHRDIKPENILFYHEHACLADFGLARAMEEIDVRVTAHGMVVGTPAYMSPEQLSDGEFDGRSDVYSLACVLYEMLAGRHAFSGKTPRELLQKRLTEPPAPVREYRSDVPALVDTLLTRALAMKRDERFQGAHELASAIEEARLEISSGRAAARRRFVARGARGMRRPFVWAGAAALALAVSALAAPPIRTAVAKNRAAANARAAALAEVKTVQEMELGRQLGTVDFAVAASRLVNARTHLQGRDSLYAEGLIALGSGAYQNACIRFDRLRATDSLDALAWYGLGDCQAMDSAVVRDPRSPSGWRFRTSWAAAANAYVHAATLSRSTNRALTFGMLGNLLPTVASQVRSGPAVDEPSRRFAAYAWAMGDSVEFVPFPVADIVAAKPFVRSASLPEALRRNRDVLVKFARQWTAAFPDNPDAFEALAAGHEARGELGNEDGEAGGALRRARSVARTPEQQVRLASKDVLLRLKRGEFESAIGLADSLLDASLKKPVSSTDASRLAGLAALTGRVAREADLRAIATSSSNADQGIAPPVTRVASELFARAASGVCDAAVPALKQELETVLDSYSQPVRRAELRRELITRPMSLTYPCFGARTFDGLPVHFPLDATQRAAARGDHKAVRAALDSLAVTRSVDVPGDIALDFVVQEAQLELAIRDTAAAVRRLDLVLHALPTLGPFAVREEAQAAAVGRAFSLRAELARASGDSVEQTRYARAALVVWRNADPAFIPALQRLRSLASPLP